MSIYEDLKPGDFSKSTKKRLPICFCLDTSGSMIAPTTSGKTRIDELNDAFSKFITAMKANDEVSASADIAMITFGGNAKILKTFTPVTKFETPKLEVNMRSLTPIGEAIQVGLKLLELRKSEYKKRGMEYYQPWLVVFTDGEPEGENAINEMNNAIAQVIELERQNKLVVFNIGIGSDVNLDIIKKLSEKREKPISVAETNLDEVFEFLGKSSDTAVSGNDNTDVLYGKEELKKGKEMKYEEWSID